MTARRKLPRQADARTASTPAMVIPDEQVAFLVPGVSVIVASRDSRMVPSVCRGVACRLSDDRRSLTVLVRRAASATLLDDIARSGWVASCHSLPSTHRTIQLKGRDGRIEPALGDDLALATEFADGFCEQLATFGYAENFVRSLLFVAPEDLAAVRFTPTELYSQTPGPDAGRRVA